ncbi:hypothetical protein PNOK_0023200 [Pyrrhoderma noxium]|uniref:Uncharacterized protein n=1 Tax=Pyrrhoderma noxium TaxID=2282107 RepID=A0A286UUC1_9AGAM|nr:hypothetical protein PNOK_0023200 [Pyrrhoderma noxium]
MSCYSEEYPNGPSCLGLDLHIENSMDILSFEFPSVRADVENYQSCSEGSSVKEPWISPDGHPENIYYNITESTQMKEFYPLECITLSAPPVPEEELCIKPEMEETIEKEIDGMSVKFAVSFSLLNGEEDPWFPVGDDLYEGRELEKLVCEVMEFNPFSQ